MIGIYKIYNNYNNRVYIGQSTNIKGRYYDHIEQLRNNTHLSKKLQLDWNQYGESAFCFDIVEQCSKETLIERERYWISVFNSAVTGYNTSPGGCNLSEEGKIRLSKNNWKNQINEDTVRLIRKELKLGKKISDITTHFGVSYNVVYYIKKGVTWKWVK